MDGGICGIVSTYKYSIYIFFVQIYTYRSQSVYYQCHSTRAASSEFACCNYQCVCVCVCCLAAEKCLSHSLRFAAAKVLWIELCTSVLCFNNYCTRRTRTQLSTCGDTFANSHIHTAQSAANRTHIHEYALRRTIRHGPWISQIHTNWHTCSQISEWKRKMNEMPLTAPFAPATLPSHSMSIDASPAIISFIIIITFSVNQRWTQENIYCCRWQHGKIYAG